MKLGSLFTGYGGLDAAAQAAGPSAETVWVTDPEIGLTRKQQLKMLGGGVVTQQGAAALRYLLDLQGLRRLSTEA